jgi:hypothetical protein
VYFLSRVVYPPLLCYNFVVVFDSSIAAYPPLKPEQVHD